MLSYQNYLTDNNFKIYEQFYIFFESVALSSLTFQVKKRTKKSSLNTINKFIVRNILHNKYLSRKIGDK